MVDKLVSALMKSGSLAIGAAAMAWAMFMMINYFDDREDIAVDDVRKLYSSQLETANQTCDIRINELKTIFNNITTSLRAPVFSPSPPLPVALDEGVPQPPEAMDAEPEDLASEDPSPEPP